MASDEVVEDYKSSLSDLAINSKPLINMLTMLAEENKEFAEHIVQAIEGHILKVSSNKKLPCLYLIDSIIKNIKNGPYLKLFMPNIVNVFCAVFEKVDEKTRQSMFKLRQTWSTMFPKTKLYALDVRVGQIDPAWPITTKPDKPAAIHINPKFIKKEDEASSASTSPAPATTPPAVDSTTTANEDDKKKAQEATAAAAAAFKKHEEEKAAALRKQAEEASAQAEAEAQLRAQLLEKQRELLYLQQKQMDLDLEQAKMKLEQQANQLKQRSAPPPPPQQQTQVMPQPVVAEQVSPVPPAAPRQSRDPRLAKARDPRLKNIENEDSRSNSPVPAPSDSSKLASHTSNDDSQNRKPQPVIKPSKSKSTPKKSLKSEKSKSSSPGKKSSSSSSSSSKSTDNKKDRRSHSSSSSKSDSKSSRSRHRSSRKSKSPEKQDGKKDEKRMKDRRNYRTNHTVSPDGDSNDSVKRKHSRSDDDEAEPPRQTYFAKRSRQVEGPGRSVRAKRAYTETKSIEEHERLAAKLAEEAKQRKAGGSDEERKDPRMPLEVNTGDKDERVKHPTYSDPDAPPRKKVKGSPGGLSDDLLGLFGTQDVDYRQMRPVTKLPPIPKLPASSRPSTTSSSSPMSSPVPSSAGVQSSDGWARFKADRPEEFPFAQPRHGVEIPESPTISGSPVEPEQPVILQEANQLLEQADSQLQQGLISKFEHQDIIKKLAELYSLQRKKQQYQRGAKGLDEAMSDDEFHSHYPMRPPPGLKRGPLLPSPRKQGPLLPNPAPHPPPRFGPAPRPHPPSLLDMKIAPIPSALASAGMPPPQPQRLPLLPPPPLPPIALNPRDPRQQKTALLETPKDFSQPPVPAGGQPLPTPPPPPPRPDDMDFLDPNNLGYDTGRFYVPQHDPRWMMKVRAMHSVEGMRTVRGGSFSEFEVILNDRYWSIPIDGRYRFVKLPKKDAGRVKVSVDLVRRELYLDGKCFYRLGQPKRSIVLFGLEMEVGFQGPRRRLWIDGHQFDVREDSPPEPVLISGEPHELGINGLTKRVVIDGHDICPCDTAEPQRAMIAFKEHEFVFKAPPREILIDNQLCQLELSGDFPAVKMNGKLHGICFDGPPRNIIINGVPYSVAMDYPRKVKIGQRPYHVGFGGPGYEVIIDDEWHELKFGGEEKIITLGSKKVSIQLPGQSPEVKILGQLTMEEQLEDAIERAAVEDEVKLKLDADDEPTTAPAPAATAPTQPAAVEPSVAADEVIPDSNAPVMPAQPVDKENMPVTVTPSGLEQQDRMFPRPWVPRHNRGRFRRGGGGGYRNNFRGGFEKMRSFPIAPAVPASTPLDIDSVLSKLLEAGIINKPAVPATDALMANKTPQGSATASPVAKVKGGASDPVPDLSDFGDGLKGKYAGVVAALYSGIQCTSCGQRFRSEQKDKYQQHLDWHFRQNTRTTASDQTVSKYRRWYNEIQEWVQFNELSDLEGTSKSQSSFFERMLQSVNVNAQAGSTGESLISCPAATDNDGDGDDLCAMCHEPFEQFWEEEDERWHLRDAVRVDNQTYHPVCYEDYKEQSVLETPTPEVQEEGPDPITDPLGYLHAINKVNAATAAAATAAAVTAPEKSTELPASTEQDVEMKDATQDATPESSQVSEGMVTSSDAASEQTTTVTVTVASTSVTETVSVTDSIAADVGKASEEDTEMQMLVEDSVPDPRPTSPAASPERQETEMEAQVDDAPMLEHTPEVGQEIEKQIEAAETPVLVQEPVEAEEEDQATSQKKGIVETSVELIVVKPEKIDDAFDSQTQDSNPEETQMETEPEELEEEVDEAKDSQETQDTITQETQEAETIVIKPESVAEESTPGASTPSMLSPAPPRGPGVERVMREHDALMSPAETLSDIDDDAIIRAQFTDLEEEEDGTDDRAGTPVADEDEELLNSHAAVTLPSKIQITISRKVPTVMPSVSPGPATPEPETEASPRPIAEPVKEEVKTEEKKVEHEEEEEDGGGTPLRDEAGTPTMDEPPTYEDPPTPLADEPSHDLPEGKAKQEGEEVDPWSLIPMDDDLSDDDFVPFVPPVQPSPVKDPPPPGTEEEPLKLLGQTVAPLASTVPIVPTPVSQGPVMQYPFPVQAAPGPAMYYPPPTMQTTPPSFTYAPAVVQAGGGAYFIPQQQQQQHQQPVSNEVQTLSTVTGHRPRDNNRPFYHNRDQHSQRRHWNDDGDGDRRYHRSKNSRERDRDDGDRRDRRRGDDRRRW